MEDRTVPSNFNAATVSDLIADINAANQQGGSNTITLVAPTISPYVVTEVDNHTDGYTKLPVVAANDNLTIVGNGDTIDGGGSLGRLFDVAAGASLTLQNLILQGGLGDPNGGPAVGAEGGAIYNHGTLDLNGATVQGNSARGDTGQSAAGGGIYSSGALTLEGGTLVQNNQALGGNRVASGGEAYGGGLFVAGGTVHLTNGTVSSNTARGGAGQAVTGSSGFKSSGGYGAPALGGGLYVAGGTLTLASATISANAAQGGAPGARSGPGVWGASGGAGLGGGLYLAGGTVNLTNATVSSNSAVGGNGGNGTIGSLGANGGIGIPAGAGGRGGYGGAGGPGIGGGMYVAAGTANLTSDTLSSNRAGGGQGGNAGNGGNGGLNLHGRGGNGGSGGWGGGGGSGLGGGMYMAAGTVNLATASLSSNIAGGGQGGRAGLGGKGGGGSPRGADGPAGGAGGTGLSGGGALDIATPASVSLDAFTLNNPPPQIAGSYATETIAVTGLSVPTVAGTAASFTVTIEDASGNSLTGYVGTVHFSSSDGQASLPADYTFTAADQGVHTFSATLKTAGTQSLTATDTVTPTQTGTEIGIVVTPAALSQLLVTAPKGVTAGAPFRITVTAADPFGNTAPGYTGTIHFSSSDSQATVPADYTFAAADQGVHTFKGVILRTAGTRIIQATDTINGALTGSARVKVGPAAVSSLRLTAPGQVHAGVAFSLTVTAIDQFGNTVPTYADTVSFTSSDGTATLPATYTFAVADKGSHAFKKGTVLRTMGNQTITVTDGAFGSIFGSVVVDVI